MNDRIVVHRYDPKQMRRLPELYMPPAGTVVDCLYEPCMTPTGIHSPAWHKVRFRLDFSHDIRWRRWRRLVGKRHIRSVHPARAGWWRLDAYRRLTGICKVYCQVNARELDEQEAMELLAELEVN